MLLNLPSSLYAAAASVRRQWYASHPERQRRLSRPVISVGNLRVGGAGKTPIVACIARELAARGERPAILSRGYARPVVASQPTIVSDGTRVLASYDTAGDEALMLARALPSVPVVVCPSRYEAGVVAEQQLGATVHVLDDGFQHLTLARDVDLLVVDASDLDDRPLPAGRLREPLTAARHASAVLTTAPTAALSRLRSALQIDTVFRVTRTLAAAQALPNAGRARPAAGDPVVAVAGIARPERFFDDLKAMGWRVVDTIAFRDHHRFTAADVERMRDALRSSGARAVLTTEKDAMRLEGLDLASTPIAAIPLIVEIEPAFFEWLLGRLHTR